MTDAERQALEAAAMAHPKMQAAMRTLRDWGCADSIGDASLRIMAACTKQYCAELMNSGHSIDEINKRLPTFIKHVKRSDSRSKGCTQWA